MGLHIADFAVLIVIALSVLGGLLRGFVKEIFSLFAWVAAGAAAYFYIFQDAGDNRIAHLAALPLAQFAIGGGIFLGLLILLNLLFRMISRAMPLDNIKAIDRPLGLAYGAARGLFVVSLAYLGVSQMLADGKTPSWLENARTTPYLLQGADFIRAFATDADAVKAGDFRVEAVKSLLPEASSARKGTPGYSENEREGMDKLIETIEERVERNQ